MTMLSYHVMRSNRHPEIYWAAKGPGHTDIFNVLEVFDLWNLSNILHVCPNKRR